jgi:glycosyltransferase involved in cell wall biosynthesis
MIRVRDFLLDQRVFRAERAPRNPAVSVVLPTYRQGRTGLLERAIASVLGQTFGDLELIVVDDGSRDGSLEVIRTWRARDPRVVHVRHDRNAGLPALRVNEGIELARGRLVAFQFDDDRWRPRALAALVEGARRGERPIVVVGKAECVDRRMPGSMVLPPGTLRLGRLRKANQIANNTVLVPRTLFDRHGMYDCHIGMRRLCDWDLWLRLIRHVDFVVVDEVISDVAFANPGAIGLTVPYDLPLFRQIAAISRDALLGPERWRDYEVDARRIGATELAADIWRRLHEEQIVPYYSALDVSTAIGDEGGPGAATGEAAGEERRVWERHARNVREQLAEASRPGKETPLRPGTWRRAARTVGAALTALRRRRLLRRRR